MINNKGALFGLVAALGLLGCQHQAQHEDLPQGVIELDERDLAFEVGGQLVSVSVKEGDRVQAGQQLAVLDTSLESALHTAREREAEAAAAQLALVKAGSRPEEVRALRAEDDAMKVSEAQLERDLAREQALLAKAASTTSAVEGVQSHLDGARAQRRALEQRLKATESGARHEEINSVQAQAEAAQQAVAVEQTRMDLHEIKSPIAGMVLDVHAKSGEILGVGAPALTIADPQHPYADVFVPQGEVGGIQVGQKAEVLVDAYPEPFAGAVENISRRTEFTPRYLFSARERPNLVVRVRVRIEDPQEKLFAGTPTFVRFFRGTQ
jgi:HlyD family secretion protein